MSKRILIEGKKFHRWTVIKYVKNRHNHSIYFCRCDCGIQREVSGNYLRSGASKSCGCYEVETRSTRNENRKIKKIYWKALRSVYHGMKIRCYSDRPSHFPQTKNYKDRGITISRGWHLFKSFYEWSISNGYEPGLQIDRINNDSGYNPQNCRWVSRTENIRNSRLMKPRQFGGEQKTILEIANKIGVRRDRIKGYLTRYSGEELFLAWKILGFKQIPKNMKLKTILRKGLF